MDSDAIVGLVAVVGLILIPSLGLTARFALKPIIESMLKIREALDRSRAPAEDARLTALETRLGSLEDAVERIAAVKAHNGRPAGGFALHRPSSIFQEVVDEAGFDFLLDQLQRFGGTDSRNERCRCQRKAKQKKAYHGRHRTRPNTLRPTGLALTSLGALNSRWESSSRFWPTRSKLSRSVGCQPMRASTRQ